MFPPSLYFGKDSDIGLVIFSSGFFPRLSVFGPFVVLEPFPLFAESLRRTFSCFCWNRGAADLERLFPGFPPLRETKVAAG